MGADGAGKVRFASFVFDRQTGDLSREGIRLRLEKQPGRLLEALLAAEGELVTREQLVAVLWPGEIAGDFDRRLDKAITKLRAVLNDSPQTPEFVETLKGRGYRFIAPYELVTVASAWSSPLIPSDPSLDPVVPELEPPFASVPHHRESPITLLQIFFEGPFGILGLTLLLIAVMGIALAYSRLPSEPLRVLGYTQLTHDGWRKDLIGVDDNNFYFIQSNHLDAIKSVSLVDGSVRQIPLTLPQPQVFDLARDGSAFLLTSGKDGYIGLWSLHLPDGTLRLLVRDVELTAAAWSPDRTKILYATTSGQLFEVHADGSEIHALNPALTPAQSGNAHPRITDLHWSPDGRGLRFTYAHTLWEMDADGSGARPLFPDWHPNGWPCCGQWSADGGFFLLSARESLFSSTLPSDRLWAVQARSPLERLMRSEPSQITSGPMRWSSAYPSRDGSMIYARGVSLRGELVRFDASIGRIEPYLAGISAEYLDFSADGRFVCYVTFPDGNLWRAARDGSNAVQLTGEPFHPVMAHFSPDSTRIAFDSTGQSGITRSWVVPVEGGKPTPLFPEEMDSQSDPVWSPDGSRMIYSTRYHGDLAAPVALRLYDLARHTITAIPNSANVSSPRWSPDGRFLVAMDDRSRSLRRYEFATQLWTPLEEGQAEFPSISRDGRWVYFLRPFNDPGVFRLPLAGGKVERVIDLNDIPLTGYYAFWLGLDPDGAPLLLRDAGMDDIYVLQLGG